MMSPGRGLAPSTPMTPSMPPPTPPALSALLQLEAAPVPPPPQDAPQVQVPVVLESQFEQADAATTDEQTAANAVYAATSGATAAATAAAGVPAWEPGFWNPHLQPWQYYR